MSSSAATRSLQARGNSAKRVAIWVCVLGLPLLYEASVLLAGPRAYYGGDGSQWFAGLNVRLGLLAIGAAAIAWALWRSGEGLASLGWPRRLRWWEVALLALTLAAAVALVFYRPPHVSPNVLKVSASTPVTLLERGWLVALSLLEAVVQETIWRGALITWLEPRLGTGGAVLVSVGSYVFFHPTFAFSWHTLLVGLPVALLYTGLFLWRRSLGPCAYVHFLLTVGQLLSPV